MINRGIEVTSENQYRLEPKEIRSISFTCSNCECKITVPLSGKHKDPSEAAWKCAVCKTEWLNGKSIKSQAFEGLIAGLKEFSRNEENGFIMSFEIAS